MRKLNRFLFAAGFIATFNIVAVADGKLVPTGEVEFTSGNHVSTYASRVHGENEVQAILDIALANQRAVFAVFVATVVLSYGAAMRLVIIPQGVRRILPAWVNQLIALIKDSRLVYFLGLVASQRELFRIGQDYAANTGNESALLLAGLFYLAITVPLTHLVNHIDQRLRRGRASGADDDQDDHDDPVAFAGQAALSAREGRNTA